jgi:hypothetical protein
MRHVDLLFFLCTILSLFPKGLGDTTGLDDPDNKTVRRLIEAIGGQELFSDALQTIADYATSLRSGIAAKVHPRYARKYQGKFGWVAQVEFDDGVKWAAKVSDEPDGLRDGAIALELVDRFCPWVAAPRPHGSPQLLGNGSLAFFLVD